MIGLAVIFAGEKLSIRSLKRGDEARCCE